MLTSLVPYDGSLGSMLSGCINTVSMRGKAYIGTDIIPTKHVGEIDGCTRVCIIHLTHNVI